MIDGYDTALRFGQRDHNVKNISSALAKMMGVHSVNPMPRWDGAMENLASYALLDGIPAEFMSDTAKEFAFQVVLTSRRELLRSA